MIADGVRLQYLDWGGSGPVILLLPGWGSSAHVFDDLAAALSPEFRVVALTQRGFGESEKPTDGYSLERYATDVAILVRELGATRVSVAGHSFGGWVVARLASTTPSWLSHAILLDAAYDLAAAESNLGQRPFERPSTAGIRSNAEYFAWLRQYFYGTWSPALEADAAINAVNWNHRAAQPALDDARAAGSQWSLVRVPALAVCSVATVASEFPWIAVSSPDYALASRYIIEVRRPFQRAECERFRRTVPTGRAVELDGGHFLFATDAGVVAAEMRRFIGSREPDR